MLKLPTFQPAEIESPAQMFRCEFYRATIAAGVCVARQQHRYAPRLAGGKVGVARVTLQYKHCASGECGQGNVIAAALKDYKPESEQEKKDRRRATATQAGQAEVAEIEKVLEETAPAMEPAPPAEEGDVGEAAESRTCDWKEELCDKVLRSDNKSGLCSRHSAVQGGRDRRAATGAKRAPRRAKKAPTLADVAKKHIGKRPTPASDDVVAILEQRRQHHLDQADRIGKALEALREVG